MNPFERYDLPDHVEPGAPNWSRRDDGSHIRRADGATVTRTSAARGWLLSFASDPGRSVLLSWHDLGVMDTLAALRHVDIEHPIPAPEPRVGQVWLVENTVETMVLAVIRGDGGPFVLCAGETEPSRWPDAVGELLLSGPGAPWAPPGWAHEV